VEGDLRAHPHNNGIKAREDHLIRIGAAALPVDPPGLPLTREEEAGDGEAHPTIINPLHNISKEDGITVHQVVVVAVIMAEEEAEDTPAGLTEVPPTGDHPPTRVAAGAALTKAVQVLYHHPQEVCLRQDSGARAVQVAHLEVVEAAGEAAQAEVALLVAFSGPRPHLPHQVKKTGC
jgi:hypothetical protein